MRRALGLAVLVLAVALRAPAAAAGSVVPFSLVVDGQLATSLLGLPASGTSTVLVVLAHGYGGSAGSWRGIMQDFADRGWLSVAMDYRGAQSAWKVTTGAADTAAATLSVRQAHPEARRTILWGASMGGQVSGMAVMRAPASTFDHWVDDVGVANWAESWAGLPPFRAVMEREGGTSRRKGLQEH